MYTGHPTGVHSKTDLISDRPPPQPHEYSTRGTSYSYLEVSDFLSFVHWLTAGNGLY